MVGGSSGKDRPYRESTLRSYKSTHSPVRAQNNARDYEDNNTFTSIFCNRAWILTMTLEEIRGQDNTMENADR